MAQNNTSVGSIIGLMTMVLFVFFISATIAENQEKQKRNLFLKKPHPACPE